MVEHGPQHLIALLHHEAAVLSAVDGKDEINRAVKAQAIVFAVGAAGLRRGVDGDKHPLFPVCKALLIGQKVDIALIVLHGKRSLARVEELILLRPLREVAVHIADAFLFAGVEGKQTEILLVGLIVAPVRRALEIHRVHGVPGALEPLVLPGKDAAARAVCRGDVAPTVHERLPLLLLGHMALIASGVPVDLRHAAPGGNAELGDDDGHCMMPPQHAQIGKIGIDRAGPIVKVLLPEQLADGRAGAGLHTRDDGLAVPDGRAVHHRGVEAIVEIVGIVGIDMIGNELPGKKGVLRTDMLHIHLRALHKKGRDILRIEERIGGRPVGEGDEPLALIAAALVFNDPVARLRQHGLKGGGVLRRGEIRALIRRHIGILVVGVGDGHILPLHTENIADDPAGNILIVKARSRAPPERDLLVAVQNVDQCAPVPDEGLKKVLVIGVAVGVLDIVVHPYAVDEPERFLVRLLARGVVLVEGVVEVVVERNVDAHGVRAHLLHLPEPAQVGLPVDGVVRRPLARKADAEVYALNGKRLGTAAAIHVNALRIRGHKGRHRLVRLQVDVPSQPVARRVISKIEQDQSGKRDDKFFHGSALAFSVVEFLISGFVAVLAQNVDVLVHPRAALDAKALHLRDGSRV